jgi:hypothetical protein
MDPRGINFEGMDLICVAQHKDHWHALVSMVMNILVAQKRELP